EPFQGGAVLAEPALHEAEAEHPRHLLGDLAAREGELVEAEGLEILAARGPRDVRDSRAGQVGGLAHRRAEVAPQKQPGPLARLREGRVVPLTRQGEEVAAVEGWFIVAVERPLLVVKRLEHGARAR